MKIYVQEVIHTSTKEKMTLNGLGLHPLES